MLLFYSLFVFLISFLHSRSKDIVEPLLKPQWYVNCQEMAAKAVKVSYLHAIIHLLNVQMELNVCWHVCMRAYACMCVHQCVHACEKCNIFILYPKIIARTRSCKTQSQCGGEL